MFGKIYAFTLFLAALCVGIMTVVYAINTIGDYLVQPRTVALFKYDEEVIREESMAALLREHPAVSKIPLVKEAWAYLGYAPKYWELGTVDGRCVGSLNPGVCDEGITPLNVRLLLAYYPEGDQYQVHCMAYHYTEESWTETKRPLGTGTMLLDGHQVGGERARAHGVLQQIKDSLNIKVPECLAQVHLTLTDVEMDYMWDDRRALRRAANATRGLP
jgi:hypothetical protein